MALRQVFNELEFRTLTKRIIDQGEANVGLEGTVQPLPESGMQGSLFGDAAPVAPQTTAKTIKSYDCDFRLIADFDEAAAYVQSLLDKERVAVHIVSVGDEAMTANILGFAICPQPHKGCLLYTSGC